MSSAAGAEALKLSLYFGERDRHGGRFLFEAVLDLIERHRLPAAALLRGAEGFGAGQRLRADRLLSLSEDLPLLATALGPREQVEIAAEEIAAIAGDGLLTLERAQLAPPQLSAGGDPEEEVKLTVYSGRRSRRNGKLAHVATIEALHRNGVAGATALFAVDGVAGGRRLRARFLSANSWVPAIIVAVGARGRIAAALAELEEGDEPLATVEAVRVCRRDGIELIPPQRCALFPHSGTEERRGGEVGGSGEGPWTRLSVYCSERSEHDGRTLYQELIRRLRAEGAAGATALRGAWGYHGDHAPHGDRLLALRRHVPVVVEAIDTPERSRRWFEIAAELTAEAGLVTAELVPAARVSGPDGYREGGLLLADPPT